MLEPSPLLFVGHHPSGIHPDGEAFLVATFLALQFASGQNNAVVVC
jgi:hypothetical protein